MASDVCANYDISRKEFVMKNIFLYFNGAVLAGIVRGYLPKNVKTNGINPWAYFLLYAVLLYSPLSFGKNHDSHRVQSQTTTQSAEESEVPSIEYVRVKMGKSIFLEPPEEDELGIYLRIRDTSGNHFELQNVVAQRLRDNGYKIVKNAKRATYVLRENILFAEEISEAQLQNLNEFDYDQGVGSVIGSTVAGAAVGSAADIYTGDHRTLGVGSVVSALVGSADGGSGITVSLVWTDKNIEFDLRIENPCQTSSSGLIFSRPVAHTQGLVTCFNSKNELIGGARYLNHLDNLPFESIVWDNAPTGNYEVFIIRQCARKRLFGGNKDAYNLCISGIADYKVEVIYGSERRVFSGKLPPYFSLVEIPHASLIKFKFVNKNSHPYCYTRPVSRLINPEGKEELCANPPF